MATDLFVGASGQWLSIPVTPTLTLQAGDSIGFDAPAGLVYVQRGNARIASWPVALGQPVPHLPVASGQTVERIFFLRRQAMAVRTVTNVSVTGAGIVRFTFSDGSQRELASHADGVAIANALDANETLAEDVLIAKAYRHSPDGTALADVIGSNCTIDTAASSPVIVTLSGAM